MKKIIFAFAVLLLIVGCTQQGYGGQAVYKEQPAYQPPTFYSLNDCHKACIGLGFEQGTCKQIGTFDADAVVGPCLMQHSTSCALPGQCECYCYRRPGQTEPKGYY